MKVGAYLMRRLAYLLFVAWGIVTITFGVMYILPRNPAVAMAGSWATEEQIRAFTERWGLDRPLWEQYARYMGYVIKGDLGTSIRTGRPVTTEIRLHFPATFELATSAILFALVVGIPLGVLSATKRNRWADHITRVLSLIGVSVPNFWLGIILLIVFYQALGWIGPGRLTMGVPEPPFVTGMMTVDSLLAGNMRAFVDSLAHLIMPSVTLGLFGVGIVARMTRSTMLEVLQKDFVKAARARGLPQRRVLYLHALRNALIPTITSSGVLYGAMLGGAIVVERVFNWPGLGNFAFQSILKADQPAILGVALVIAIIYSAVNLLVDVAYRYLDPRIGHGG